MRISKDISLCKFPVGEWIKQNRENLGMNKARLSEAVGIDHVTLLYYENGRCMPSLLTFFDIVDAFGLEVKFVKKKGATNDTKPY